MLERVSIGGTLAEARRQAGLTVADVSARTRVRQTLIRAIERDEFAPCGGDFYARGHIRAIARTVGVDSRPLISEYDAAHPSGQPVTMDDLLSRSAPGRRRHQHPREEGKPEEPKGEEPKGEERPQRKKPRARGLWGLLGLLLVALAVISLGSYRLVTASTGDQRPAAVASRASVRPRSPRPSQRPSPAAVSPSVAPSASPRSSPSAAPVTVSEVTPVSAAAFGPGGTSDGDDPQNASLALSGDPATAWNTDWYTTARFGNLKSGTGLLLDLGRTVTATGLTIGLGATPGADLQVRAGTSLASMTTVAAASGAGGTVKLSLTSPAAARYLLIWFTLLPPDADGTYQVDVSAVRVTSQNSR
jgi:cytoskeletal protein RodZ